MFNILCNIRAYETLKGYEDIKETWCYQPQTNEELREAVDFWCKNPIEGIKKYGHIGNWDVSNVCYMSNTFSYCTLTISSESI